jgi:hypothetical protein
MASKNATSALLFDAIMDSQWSVAEGLILEDRGLLFRSRVHDNNTVLQAACVKNAPTHLIELLLSKGLNVGERNDVSEICENL